MGESLDHAFWDSSSKVFLTDIHSNCIPDDDIFYREGTYRKCGEKGESWTQVSGALCSISVGDDIVVGSNAEGNLYVRVGECGRDGCGLDPV